MGAYEVVFGSLKSSKQISGNVVRLSGSNVQANSVNLLTAIATNCVDSGNNYVPLTAATTGGFLVRPGTEFLLDSVSTRRMNWPAGFLVLDMSMKIGRSTGVPFYYKGTIINGFFGNFEIQALLSGDGNCSGGGATKIKTLAKVGFLQNYRAIVDPYGVEFVAANWPTTPSQTLISQFIPVEGTYSLWSSSLAIVTPSPSEITPTQLFDGGVVVDITDGESKLDKVTSITVQFIPADGSGVLENRIFFYTIPTANITLQTSGQITFTLPPMFQELICEYTDLDDPSVFTCFPDFELIFPYFEIPYINIGFNVNDPTFPETISGPVPMASIEILWNETATGVYTVTEGKTNDTLYDNDNPGITDIVKIPDPFIKTGFVGG